jgi:hypothetical protein
MPKEVIFSFGPLIATAGAHIEELGAEPADRLVKFPFISGLLRIPTGFSGRRWKARCYIIGADISALASRRASLRLLEGVEEVLTVSGESFAPVVISGGTLRFGAVRSDASGLVQEVSVEFIQLREGAEA